jgi:serine/threonine protein kinase
MSQLSSDTGNGKGSVILFGGAFKSSSDNTQDVLCPGTYIFDSFQDNTDSWRELVFSPESIKPPLRIGHSIAKLIDGTVILYGGASNVAFIGRKFLSDTWLLRKQKNTLQWENTVLLRKPVGRMNHVMANLSPNKVLLYGGCVGDKFREGCVTFLQDVWLFVVPQFEQGLWLPIDSIDDSGFCGIGPGLRANAVLATLSKSKTVVLFGGRINGIEGTMYETSFAGDTWIMEDGCPTGWHIANVSEGSGCQPCEKGTYSSNHSLTECIKCPVGLTTERSKMNRAEDCTVCEKPTRLTFGKCVRQCVDGDQHDCFAQWSCEPFSWGPFCANMCAGNNNVHGFVVPCNNRGRCNNCVPGDQHKSCNTSTITKVPAGQCLCESRYAGIGCEIDCGVNGHKDDNNPLVCKCEYGYTGTQCTLQCRNNQPVARNRTIVNGTATYGRCLCSFPWNADALCESALYVVLLILMLFVVLVSSVYYFRSYWKHEISDAQFRNDAEKTLLTAEWQQEVSLLSEGRRIDGDDIEFEIMIAEGSFGEVWRGVWRMLPDRYVAIKKIKLELTLEQTLEQQERLNFEVVETKAESSTSPSPSPPLNESDKKFKSWANNTQQNNSHRRHTRGSKSEGDGSLLLSNFDDGAVMFGKEGSSAPRTMTEQEGDTAWIDQEIMLLMRIKSHARTVLFHGAGRLKDTGEIFLVSEYMQNGDLWSALEKRPTMSWVNRIQIAADIAEGMAFLHSRKPPLVHRDLKSQNVLLGLDGRAKVCDFGLSRFAEVREERAAVARMSFATDAGGERIMEALDAIDATTTVAMMTGQQGSLLWMAPEIDTNKKSVKYGLAVDVYSYAIVLLELITCRKPWEEVSWVHQIQAKVENGERPNISALEEKQARDNDAGMLLEWMRHCWQQNPQDRPKFTTVLHAFRKVESVQNTYQQDRRSSLTSRSVTPLVGSDRIHNKNSSTDGTYMAPSFTSKEEQQRRAMGRSLPHHVDDDSMHTSSRRYSSLSVMTSSTNSQEIFDEFTRII